MKQGQRGFRGGIGLRDFLCRHGRAARRVDMTQILAWADSYHKKTGRWPLATSGIIAGAGGLQWQMVDRALRNGVLRVPRCDSLRSLLTEYRKLRRGPKDAIVRAPLDVDQILNWADSFHDRTGKWPSVNSGDVPEAPGETWVKLDTALRYSRRGLPGDSSLAQLLDKHRRAPIH